ncbi:Crp/Fnr family transcriptional regulator [Paenilisteria newyorkensis]|uniref:Crp/Fnr family transcriptional regulator n=1 Tax=Listeria newyorkensis TaxID=1497681 RepID=UPI00066A11AE|nr:Crp/Fnr family transcriptional regulator [Listeria newyorkensis]KMT58228.1 CRP/FNR family transcription regulator [Listeria newyorkensis]
MQTFINFLLDDEFLAIKGEQITLKRGEQLLLEDAGNKPQYVFGISEGIAAIKSEETILEFIGTGQFIGLYTDGKATLHGEIVSKEATVWKFELKDVLSKVAQNKNGLQLYNKHITHIQENLLKKSSIMMLNKSNRLLLSLRMLASRFGEVSEDKGVIRLPQDFTKKILANYTDIKLATLTGTLNKLNEEGKIIHGRRVLLISS